MKKLQNYINGKFQPPVSDEYIENIDPSRGVLFSLIPDSGMEDVAQATEAAKAAFPIWSGMSLNQRSEILMKLSKGIEDRMDEFVAAESLDNGKPVSLARQVDIPRAVSNLSFFATAVLHFASESHYMEGVGINYTTRKPIGVVGCISPWNLPLYLFTWKIEHALASGNSVIAKHSEITPYTT